MPLQHAQNILSHTAFLDTPSPAKPSAHNVKIRGAHTLHSILAELLMFKTGHDSTQSLVEPISLRLWLLSSVATEVKENVVLGQELEKNIENR